MNTNFNQNGNHGSFNSKSQNKSNDKSDLLLLPIPNNQEKLLKNEQCNFSLYSPRMVRWKIEWKKEESNLKSDTETIAELNKKAKSLFSPSAILGEISKKQQKQNAYMEFLKKQGIQTFSITAKTASPFVTGLGSGHPTETGMILDRNMGIPYIPASSIKGVLRLAHAINIANGRSEIPESELETYFGTSDPKRKNQYKGQLVILDAYPKESVELTVDIMNPHFSKYYNGENKQPVETDAPNPIKFLTVQQGTEFIFNCAFIPLKEKSSLSESEQKEIEAMFDTAFTKVGFGGKTSIGYGRFEKSDNKANIIQSTQSHPVEKEVITAGEYEAVVTEIDKNGSIFFKFMKENAVKRNCNKKMLSNYKKKDKVKIKIDGKKNKDGAYVAEEIISI